MKNKYFKYLIVYITLLLFNINFCHADTYKGKVTGSGVNLRSGPGTNYETVKSVSKGNYYMLVSNTLHNSEEGCESGWYQIYYEGETSGFICSNYLEVSLASEEVSDEYNRPWTTPAGAIIGGAKFITEKYINAGQFTSYLKKFNVNPESEYNVYNHQYMANLQAPYSEAYSSFKSYRDNDLLKLPIAFSIPIYEEMPEYTILPGNDANTTCQSEVIDLGFEALLNEQGFPESYKCKLRIIHNSHPNWIFNAMHTGLDFNKSVIAEQNVSSIQGGDKYYDLTSGSRVETESNWYRANKETVAYYLDPRNFLNEERILMFEKLSYSENYTTTVVSTILKGTFMDGISILDNKTYAEIFIEAGLTANISSVYLASLARQESGANGSRATSGQEFTYKGITYIGLYNFYNIGANSSAESPILAGLVWASGGSTSVIVNGNKEENNDSNENNNNTDNNENTEEIVVLNEQEVLTKLGVEKKNDCLLGLSINTTLGSLKQKLPDLILSIDNVGDEGIIKTGQRITITDGFTTFIYTIVVSGDVDGDGAIGATDYVKIKNYIMEKENSELNIEQSLASDVDNNNEIGATDYVKIKNSIMER